MLNKLLLLVNLVAIVKCGVNNSPTYDPYEKTIDCTANGKTAADICDITLVVEALSSMTYYNISSSFRELRGYRAGFNSVGNIVTLLQESDIPNREMLLPPIQVDGCFRPLIAINGQMPGPTIITHENQTLNITVYNELVPNVEGVTIHWHGMHQLGTQGADGAAFITQRPIPPQHQFTYTFRAYPTGTYWYHAHSGAQRADGLYGALIIKDTIPGNLYHFDTPEDHTLILMDWQKEAAVNQYYPEANAMEYFKPAPSFDPPFQLYNDTRSSDQTQVGFAPFWSAIINDKGRHFDEQGMTSIRPQSLNYFTVSQGGRYRFRLIGAQAVFPFRFSIQDHVMTVIATDGSPIVPIENVTYVIVNSGERYDVVVHANNQPGNFWIWAETLEDAGLSGNEVFNSPISKHRAEAVLQYRGVGLDIDETDQLRTCTPSTCIAVNCPFQQYGPNIRCINADRFESLSDHVIPQSIYTPDTTLFYNFGDDGETSTERDALDGINFRFPSNPPLTEYAAFQRSGAMCPTTRGCDHDVESFCSCTQVIDISNYPRGGVVEMVFTNRAVERNSPDGTSHPVHLHGHHFYVVKIGYPVYNENGEFVTVNDEIECVSQSNAPCPGNFITIQDQSTSSMKQVVRWTNMTRPAKLDEKNRSYARKDTVIVPFGGYTVVRFLVDNPGWWFLHCHIEIHQLEGMSAVVRELPNELPPEFSNNNNNMNQNTDMPPTCQPCSNVTSTGATQSDLRRSSLMVITAFVIVMVAIVL